MIENNLSNGNFSLISSNPIIFVSALTLWKAKFFEGLKFLPSSTTTFLTLEMDLITSPFPLLPNAPSLSFSSIKTIDLVIEGSL
jgi:hypothetical protein